MKVSDKDTGFFYEFSAILVSLGLISDNEEEAFDILVFEYWDNS